MRGGDLAIRQARDTTTQGRSQTVAIAVTTNNDDKKGAWSGSIFLFPLSFLPVPLRGVRLGGTKSLGLTHFRVYPALRERQKKQTPHCYSCMHCSVLRSLLFRIKAGP